MDAGSKVSAEMRDGTAHVDRWMNDVAVQVADGEAGAELRLPFTKPMPAVVLIQSNLRKPKSCLWEYVFRYACRWSVDSRLWRHDVWNRRKAVA